MEEGLDSETQGSVHVLRRPSRLERVSALVQLKEGQSLRPGRKRLAKNVPRRTDPSPGTSLSLRSAWSPGKGRAGRKSRPPVQSSHGHLGARAASGPREGARGAKEGLALPGWPGSRPVRVLVSEAWPADLITAPVCVCHSRAPPSPASIQTALPPQHWEVRALSLRSL